MAVYKTYKLTKTGLEIEAALNKIEIIPTPSSIVTTTELNAVDNKISANATSSNKALSESEIDTKLEGYLPLTGGTIDGILSIKDKTSLSIIDATTNDCETSLLKRADDVGRTVFYGGDAWDKGAFLEFYGANISTSFYPFDYDNRRGQFILGTGQGTTGDYELIGQTDGNLLWKNTRTTSASTIKHVAFTEDTQTKITYGTSTPSGGSDGDVYIQYE